MEPTTEGAKQPVKKPCPPERHRYDHPNDTFIRRLGRSLTQHRCADCGETFNVDTSD